MSNNMPLSIGQVTNGSWSFSLPIRSRHPGPGQSMGSQFGSANQMQNELETQNEPSHRPLTLPIRSKNPGPGQTAGQSMEFHSGNANQPQHEPSHTPITLPIRSRNPGSAQNMADQSMGLRFDSANQTQNEPKPQNEPGCKPLTHEESEEESEDETGESWSDDSMEDEEEIIVCLNQRALAMLPRRLQIIMTEMHILRYKSLKIENPDVRVMPEDYWITPLQPLDPTRVMKAPIPLFAMPQRIVSSTAYQDGFRDGYESDQTAYAQTQAQAYIQSLGPGNNHRRWSAQVTPSRNAFAAAPPVNVNFSRRQLRRNSHGILQPENVFSVLNGYHRPLPPNFVFTQQHNNSTNIRGGSGLKSLSIRPVAKSLRKGFKRSLSRLNKWMKS